MLSLVDVLLTIGEFSKMTHLSVKALRHYHEVGLLEPAEIDRSSGYRRYSASQVSTAQAIRRFRDLDMPIEDVRAVLLAPDAEARDEAILAHLRRMQDQLTRTQDAVASLRSLLEGIATPGDVTFRSVGATNALAVTGRISLQACADWLDAAFAEILTAAGLHVTGDTSALYFDDVFASETGRVVAYVPVSDDATATGRAQHYVVPASELAVLVHEGPFTELDRTYGALGAAVVSRGIGAAGPIREHYLDDEVAEVCWPITTNPKELHP